MNVDLTIAERDKLIYLLTQEMEYLALRAASSKYFKDELQVVVTAANKLSELKEHGTC